MSYLLFNCRTVDETGAFRPSCVLFESCSGKIVSIESSDPLIIEDNADDNITHKTIHVDCKGGILSPGFIDIQINGADGVDFSSPDLTEEDVIKVSKSLPKYGVTSFCPTIISSSRSVYKRNIALISQICKKWNCEDDNITDTDTDTGSDSASANPSLNDIGANILGLHLEGPFFALTKKGAHNADCIKETVSMSSMSDTYSSNNFKDGSIKIITMAPELPGALPTIQALAGQGVVVAMGHTNATLLQGMQGVINGVTLVTHLFNAMKPFHHREPGLLGLFQCNESPTVQPKMTQKQNSFLSPYFSIIVDGLHSHPTSVKMAYNLNPNKLVLVTDAMSAMGLGGGSHSLGSASVTVDGNRATISGTDTLAGSVISMDRCVRNLKQFTGCSTHDALSAATLHPAKVLGRENEFGTLRIGSCADLVLLDDDLNVVKTWVRGKMVYEKHLRKRKL